MTVHEQARYSPWLHRFPVLAALVTFLLLGLGGLVISHGAGLCVPDWPNSYGHNLFFFPVAHWVDGIFYEHYHRLLASFVGLLVVALASLAGFWLGWIVVQIFPGTATIWTSKAADVAAAQVSGGALGLVVGAKWCVLAVSRSREVPEMKPATSSGLYGMAPAMAANK